MAYQIKSPAHLSSEIKIPPLIFAGSILIGMLVLLIFFHYNQAVYLLPFAFLFALLVFIILGEHRLRILALLTVAIPCLLPAPTLRTLLFRIEEIPYFLLLLLTFHRFLLTDERPSLNKPLNRAIFIFLLISVVGGFVGFVRGHRVARILDEFLILFYYGFFFLALLYFQNERWQRWLVYTIILVSFIVALQYLIPFLLTLKVKRYATDQQHLFNLAYPLVVSYLFFGKRSLYKIFLAFVLLPMTLAVFLTFTRAIWLTIPLSILIIIIIYLFSSGLKAKLIARIGVIIVILLGIMVAAYDLLKYERGFQTFFRMRWETMRKLGYDISILERVSYAHNAFEQFKKSPLLGTGLGSFVMHVLIKKPGVTNPWLDFTYLSVLWKLGIIGLLVFLYIYFRFFKDMLWVIKNPPSNFHYWVAVGTFSAFVSLAILGVESGILLTYRYNLVWAAIIAVFNLWTKK